MPPIASSLDHAVIAEIIAVLAFVAALSAAWLSARRRSSNNMSEHEYIAHLERKINELTSDKRTLSDQVNNLSAQNAELFRRLREAESRVEIMSQQLDLAREKIKIIEGAQAAQPSTRRRRPPVKPLLMITAGDASDPFAQADLNALARVHGRENESLRFHRLLKATKDDVAREIQRKREERSPYRWLHITSHATAEGVELADGKADGSFWASVLSGIEGVFLASCSNVRVSDGFVGLVQFVVVVYEPIQNQYVSEFAHAFWENLLMLDNADQAFIAATEEVPQVASYVDIRHS